MTSVSGRASALAVAAAAFALYYATLLPGFDFGDTGFLQTTVDSASLTPRDGYPLYFGIGHVFVWLTRGEPARALNLASAVEGAVACGLTALVAAELSGSMLAAIGAGLIFAASYTFWSQAIIAEVYALHAVFVSLSLLLLLRWDDRPTVKRLAMFFAAYAIGFGNHLSMILLLPGCAIFLLVSPGGGRSMFRPRVVALAVAIACAGALQYAWNFRGLWQWPSPPPGVIDGLKTFWFDVTKSDWRETMILRLPESMVRDRLAMYRFELVQQFGWAALLAPIGLARLFATHWRRGLLMALLFVVNAAFAFTYNVGDTHVFYLPSHLVVAMLMAPGVVWIADAIPLRRAARVGFPLLLIAYASARMCRDYPALDRSDDRRPTEVMAALTRGLDDQHAILLADLNWQLVNGLAYFGKVTRPDVAYAWMFEMGPYTPALVRDNLAIGRQVALTARARALVANAYGPLLPTEPDLRVRIATLTETVRDLPAGTRYVLCVLRPFGEFALNRPDLDAALRALTSGAATMPAGDYAAVAGLAGRAPVLAAGSPAPFHVAAALDAVPIEVRMESWLTFDMIRRMGFGHAVAAHHHTLIVERGVSFAAFDAEGRAFRTFYDANIFARQPRYLIR